MKYIIPMIVGSAIGYFTNWLAIKMLFRPHREIRWLGIKVPFTPGLIPKERYRISKSIGDAVGQHLLTPEKIREVLWRKETQENLNRYLKSYVEKLKLDSRTIMDIGKSRDKNSYDNYILKIKSSLSRYIVSKFKAKTFKSLFLDFIDNNIYERYRLLALNSIELNGANLLDEMFSSQGFRELIKEELNNGIQGYKEDNRLLKHVISKDTIDNIYSGIDRNRGKIVQGLKDIFRDSELSNRLKNSIKNLVSQNMNGMLMMFLDPSTIADKIFNIIQRYIDSPEAEKFILFSIDNVIDRILEKKISTLICELEEFIDQDSIGDMIVKYLSEGIDHEDIIELIIKEIQNRDSIKERILESISYGFEDIVNSQDFHKWIFSVVDISIDNILNTPMESMLKNFDVSHIESITRTARSVFSLFFQDVLMDIIDLFDISQIVEEEINSFEVEYTEELILNIAEKELKAITNLGALLGGIMGLLSPLLQMIS